MSAMTEPLLDVRQLSRRFAAVDALKEVNFSVEAGEVHALIGPNGAGKTTFIHHVSGALQPDSGSVHFAGREVTRLAMHQRVAAGMARSYQISNVFLGLSVLDNVALAVQGRPDAGSKKRVASLNRSDWTAVWKASPAISPMANKGRWNWPWHWPPSRNCCCLMNRWPAPARKSRHGWSS